MIRRPRAGVDGEPRARVRLRGGGARPLERAARRCRRPTASRWSSSRARAPASCRATPRIWRCARSRCFAPIEGHRFRFVNRIPLERGLGSSAATVAAGLVAGLAAAGRDASLDELLELGLPLEGHADNLAAALQRRRLPDLARRRAGHALRGSPTDLPLAAILVVPERAREHERVALPPAGVHPARGGGRRGRARGAARRRDRRRRRRAARRRLPRPAARAVPRSPTRRSSASSARLPARARSASRCPAPGPTVVVWAEKAKADAAAAELEERADAEVLPLAIAACCTSPSRPRQEPADWSSDMSVYTQAIRSGQAPQRRADRRRRPRPGARDAEGRRLHRRGSREAARRRRDDLDRDDAVQLEPARARQAREGRASAPRAARRSSSTRSRSPTASRWGRPACAPRSSRAR